MAKLSSALRYVPSFFWFERATHIILVEWMQRLFVPNLAEGGEGDDRG
jgi:hypothetical protein